MDLTNFILLAVERNMVSNKNGLDIFYTAFKEASQNNDYETKILDEDRDEETAQNSVLVGRNFYLAITMLAKAIFGHEDSPFQALFSQMLVDQVASHKGGCKLLLNLISSDRRQEPQDVRGYVLCSVRGSHQDVPSLLPTAQSIVHAAHPLELQQPPQEDHQLEGNRTKKHWYGCIRLFKDVSLLFTNDSHSQYRRSLRFRQVDYSTHHS